MADQSLRRVSGTQFSCEAWDDGFAAHAPVGSLRPNAFGLHDVVGNVQEWVQDTYHPSYQGAPVDGVARDEVGASDRVFRGGSWNVVASFTRAAMRFRSTPAYRGTLLGLRPASDLDP